MQIVVFPALEEISRQGKHKAFRHVLENLSFEWNENNPYSKPFPNLELKLEKIDVPVEE